MAAGAHPGDGEGGAWAGTGELWAGPAYKVMVAITGR